MRRRQAFVYILFYASQKVRQMEGRTEKSPSLEITDETLNIEEEMSFVMAEEEANSNQEDIMSQSKYAQVIGRFLTQYFSPYL